MAKKSKELLSANRLIDLQQRYIRYVQAMIQQGEVPITFDEWNSP